MKSSDGRHGGNRRTSDKHEAEQAKGRGLAHSLSGARDRNEAEGHTSGKD
jgi:hypothetical protein